MDTVKHRSSIDKSDLHVQMEFDYVFYLVTIWYKRVQRMSEWVF